MGEVYRGRDTKLGREVAIKVILGVFAADPDRVARFEREAKVLASLNHPHIASLYGMEQSGAQHFLVMELVEGQTLAERLLRDPLPVEETLAIALQIADALEGAHEKGIVHRDLKPANVKLTPDDRVKLLDFGLAKAMETDAVAANVANSPTLSMMASQAGVILGTAAYMSPEQAKGFPADHRSDIFAFGVVVYEMLTGRQPFLGETAPDVLASVLVREADMTRLPADVNPRLTELVRRCLEKQPKRRWQAIGDVRAELEAVALAPWMLPGDAHPRLPLWKRALPAVMSAIVIGTMAAAAAWYLKPFPAAPVSLVARFSIAIPPEEHFGVGGRPVLAIAPDGSQFVYIAGQRLYLRRLSETAAQPVAGSETLRGLNSPAFSPDGRSVAYFANDEQQLKRIDVSGGAPVPLGPATNPFGISWSAGGILFAQSEPNARGILRISANGDKREHLVTINDSETAGGPQMLPDGETVLFALATGVDADRWDKAKVVAQSIGTGARKILVDGGSEPRYVSTGHLLYMVAGTVYAVAFNPRSLEVGPGRTPVIEGVRRSAGQLAAAHWAVSANGSLIYVAGGVGRELSPVTLGIVDRQGAVTPIGIPAGPYFTPRASPDGTRIAFGSDDGKDAFIAVYDLSGARVMRRVTFSGHNRFPVWSPDSKRIAFQSDRNGDRAIFSQAADGTGTAERLTKPAAGESHVPDSWSSDGAMLLFDVDKDLDTLLWTLSLKNRTTAKIEGVLSGAPTSAVFSPDGRWIAYTAMENRRTHFYVQPFPPTGEKYQLTDTTAETLNYHPTWSLDGKTLKLNYLDRSAGFEAVSITTQGGFGFGNPVELKRPFQGVGVLGRRSYDMMAGGAVVALFSTGDTAPARVAPTGIEIVLNWFEDLKARAAR